MEHNLDMFLFNTLASKVEEETTSVSYYKNQMEEMERNMKSEAHSLKESTSMAIMALNRLSNEDRLNLYKSTFAKYNINGNKTQIKLLFGAVGLKIDKFHIDDLNPCYMIVSIVDCTPEKLADFVIDLSKKIQVKMNLSFGPWKNITIEDSNDRWSWKSLTVSIDKDTRDCSFDFKTDKTEERLATGRENLIDIIKKMYDEIYKDIEAEEKKKK